MPKISVGTYVQGSGSNSGSPMDEIRNPLSVWRNTVRIRPNEYSVIKFMGEGGDLSRYHNIPGMTRDGARFTKYEYCSRLNLDAEGKQVREDPCTFCMSSDENISNTTERFLAWAFHYGTFHSAQNPRLDRDGQEPWDEIRRGQKLFYRETVRKPQLFQASFTLYKNLESKREMMDSLTERNFDYSCMRVTDRTTYSLDYSDTPLTNDYASEIKDVERDLPDIEAVAAKLITEIDVPQFGNNDSDGYRMNSQTTQQIANEESAFSNMTTTQNETND